MECIRQSIKNKHSPLLNNHFHSQLLNFSLHIIVSVLTAPSGKSSILKVWDPFIPPGWNCYTEKQWEEQSLQLFDADNLWSLTLCLFVFWLLNVSATWTVHSRDRSTCNHNETEASDLSCQLTFYFTLHLSTTYTTWGVAGSLPLIPLGASREERDVCLLHVGIPGQEGCCTEIVSLWLR